MSGEIPESNSMVQMSFNSFVDSGLLCSSFFRPGCLMLIWPTLSPFSSLQKGYSRCHSLPGVPAVILCLACITLFGWFYDQPPQLE